MNLLLNIHQFNLSNIYFLDKKTNMIMDGVFTKIRFSTNCVSMNGLYIELPMKNIMTNKVYSKNIIQLDTINNKDLFQKLIDIEKQLLQYYIQYFSQSQNGFQSNDLCNPIQNKTIVYTLKNNILSGAIKYYNIYDSHYKPGLFYIKISGIWENKLEIGITFKIIEYQKQI